jgi:hypothetical protein
MKPAAVVSVRRLLVIGICAVAFGLPLQLHAGGPLFVGGPSFGVDGQPFTWDPAAMPIQYRVDGGPMASTATGQIVITNATGIARVQAMFQTSAEGSHWPVAFKNAGLFFQFPGSATAMSVPPPNSMPFLVCARRYAESDYLSTPIATFCPSSAGPTRDRLSQPSVS